MLLHSIFSLLLTSNFASASSAATGPDAMAKRHYVGVCEVYNSAGKTISRILDLPAGKNALVYFEAGYQYVVNFDWTNEVLNNPYPGQPTLTMTILNGDKVVAENESQVGNRLYNRTALRAPGPMNNFECHPIENTSWVCEDSGESAH